jgi:hypothetical protein
VAGGWRRLHNEELHKILLGRSIGMRWTRYAVRIGETSIVYKILIGKLERKRPFGRPKSRCDDIRMDLREIGWEGVDWIIVAQVRDQ